LAAFTTIRQKLGIGIRPMTVHELGEYFDFFINLASFRLVVPAAVIGMISWLIRLDD
jgi:hypothetical protein